jgi:hypothetical protein
MSIVTKEENVSGSAFASSLWSTYLLLISEEDDVSNWVSVSMSDIMFKNGGKKVMETGKKSEKGTPADARTFIAGTKTFADFRLRLEFCPVAQYGHF